IDQLLPFCNNLLRTCAHMSDSSSELCHFSRKPVTDLQHFFGALTEVCNRVVACGRHDHATSGLSAHRAVPGVDQRLHAESACFQEVSPLQAG
ncbi:MAG: hypothetical protein ACFCUJ_03575, partial [Thiotrichales bacterium]